MNYFVIKVFILVFFENKKLDFKRILVFYLKRIELFRKFLKGKDEIKLFIFLNVFYKLVLI